MLLLNMAIKVEEYIRERKLYSRLKGLRENSEKALALAEFDEHGLLTGDHVAQAKEPYKIDNVNDVLNDPLGLLGGDSDDPESIFVLKHIPQFQASPDHVARREKCDDFAQFEPMFKQVHADLVTGDRVMRNFKSETQISKGKFFILRGQLAYIAGEGVAEKVDTNIAGGVQIRMYCIFENGTESYMLRRSLASALWTNDNSSEVVTAEMNKVYDQAEADSEGDGSTASTGHIYILKSLSEDLQIRELEDLFKIGFSTQPIQQRIQNAEKEPTFLMGKVDVVASYETYDLNPQKFELLIHTFFAECCLNLDVFDSTGKRFTPREWFVVPLHIINSAIDLLVSGEIIEYRYDRDSKAIVPRNVG